MKYPGLQSPMNHDQRRNRLLDYIRQFLRSQFGHPKGFWGNVAGMIMENTPSNQDRIHWMISLLEIGPMDRLLEIGFGPGYAIELASTIASKGFVAGIDHSEVMIRQARKRNAAAIRNGRVVLLHGSVSHLPKFKEPFDKIFTINSIHFWVEPVDCLRELRKLLRPGGMIAVMLQPRSRSATDDTTKEAGNEIARNLEIAGYSDVRLEIRKAKPISVACMIGFN